MANAQVALVRIDTRMVHGAVVSAWAKKCGTKRVVMVDDFLMKDPFMVNFYKKGKKRPVAIEVVDPVKAGEAWQAGTFVDKYAKGKSVMVIAKDAQNLSAMWKAGFPLTEVNIGKNNYETGKHEITMTVFFNKEELGLLQEMVDAGVRVYVQVSPGDAPIEWDEVLRIYAENKTAAPQLGAKKSTRE